MQSHDEAVQKAQGNSNIALSHHTHSKHNLGLEGAQIS